MDFLIESAAVIFVFIFFMSVPTLFFAKVLAKGDPKFRHWIVALLISIAGFVFVFGDNAGWY